jgi:hypothetical protein
VHSLPISLTHPFKARIRQGVWIFTLGKQLNETRSIRQFLCGVFVVTLRTATYKYSFP